MEEHCRNITAWIRFPIRFWEWICCPAGFPFLAAKFRWRIKFWALLVFADWFISLILFSTTFSDFGNRKHILSDIRLSGPFSNNKGKEGEKENIYFHFLLALLTLWQFLLSVRSYTWHLLINVQSGSTRISLIKRTLF